MIFLYHFSRIFVRFFPFRVSVCFDLNLSGSAIISDGVFWIVFASYLHFKLFSALSFTCCLRCCRSLCLLSWLCSMRARIKHLKQVNERTFHSNLNKYLPTNGENKGKRWNGTKQINEIIFFATIITGPTTHTISEQTMFGVHK